VVFARVGATPVAGLQAEAAAASIQPMAPPPAPADIPALEATPSVRLPDVADLCADLARVLDGAEVNALMGRAVQVLGAKGAVLWVIDTTGAFLRPLVLHGYPDKVARRLGALQVDADNAKVSLADMHDQYSRGIPIGRIGEPDEIASAVALLARNDLGAFVGQTIQVNGGTTRCRA